VPAGLLCSALPSEIPWLAISEVLPSDFSPPDPQASSIVVGQRPRIISFNVTAGRVFTSFVVFACCRF